MLRTTTSRPTPRPDTSVTALAVEKPSVKMSWIASRSLSVSPACSRPRSSAFLRTEAASMPAPSSISVITTWFDSCAAESSSVPVSDLPRALRTAGGLDAVVDGVADQVHERLAELVDHRLVDARVLALQHELDALALLAREVAHQPREALEDVADRQHPHVHDRLLQLRRGARHPVDGLEQVRPHAGQHLGHVPRELAELGPVDDQLPHQVEQVIELGEVDAHHARAQPAPGAVSAAPPSARRRRGAAGRRRRPRDEGRERGQRRARGPSARGRDRRRPRSRHAAPWPPRTAGRAPRGRAPATRRGRARTPPRGGGRSPSPRRGRSSRCCP